MKNETSKKRNIDDLYESRREAGFYTGDGTSHRPKNDITIQRKHIITAVILVAFVIAAVIAMAFYGNKLTGLEDKVTDYTSSELEEEKQKEENAKDKTVSMNSNTAPWFSVSSSGTLYFHSEKFEGSHLIIPKRFNNKAVQKLDGESFSRKNKYITQLTIHEGLQAIGDGAFSSFTSLDTVNLCATLQRIGADSFSGTPWYKNNTDEFLIVGKGVLIKYGGDDSEITIPENVAVIDGAVFQGVNCKTVIIPDGTTCIGVRAFKDCTAEEIVIPDSVQFVERDAFEGCNWLEARDEEFVIEGSGILLKCNSTESTVRLPNEVVMISGFDPKEQGKDMTLVLGAKVAKIADLEALGNVKAFKVDARNSVLKAKSGVLYSADGSTLYRYPTYKGGTTFYMSDDTLKIGNNAFSGSQLKTVELYDGLLVVGNEAFKNCKKLSSIDIPDTVTELGTFVFEGCEKLSDATVSESIKILPHGTFKNCRSLKSVALSEGMSTISPFSFKGCENLKYFYVTKNVMLLSDLAFEECVEFDVDDANKYYKAEDGKLKEMDDENKQAVSQLIGTETEKAPF